MFTNPPSKKRKNYINKKVNKPTIQEIESSGNAFWNAMDNNSKTANGAIAYKNTGQPLLDLYKFLGDSRYSFDENTLDTLITSAVQDDLLYTLKILFWCRDIRGIGAGNRDVFRSILDKAYKSTSGLAYYDIKLGMLNTISLIPFYGRWDDLYSFFGTETLNLIKYQLSEDMKHYENNEFSKISLLAKWLPREGSKKYPSYIYKTIVKRLFNGDRALYRKWIVQLTDVVEQKMSSRKWDNIDYSKLPSKAAMLYSKAFMRHDAERYNRYLNNLSSPTSRGVKINTVSLEPYDVVGDILRTHKHDQRLLKGIWKNFDQTESTIPILPVVDVSDSMTWYNNSLDKAIAFGIYVAERNPGSWKNKYFEFSSRAAMVELKGNDIVQKVSSLSKASWGGNTNIEAIFTQILTNAKNHGLTNEQMPKAVIIISDGQYDYQKNTDESTYQTMIKRFKNQGYDAPLLIEWNLNGSKYNNSNVLAKQKGIISISGFSKNIFKALLTLDLENIANGAKEIDPITAMFDILDNERYSMITL